jgi:glycosyltransferase involved in cell wall biosynthesis
MKRLLVFTGSGIYDPASRLRGKNLVDSLCNLGFEATWYPYEKINHPIPEFLHVAKDFLSKLAIVRDSPPDTGIMIQRTITEYEDLQWNKIKYLSRALHGMPKFTFLSFVFAFFSKFVFKRRLVYDFDDGLFLERPLEIPMILKTADLVLVGSHALYYYARRYSPNVQLVPTCPNIEGASRRKLHRSNRHVVLGFVGSPSATGYMRELLAPLSELAQTHKFELTIASAHLDQEYEPFKSLFGEFRIRGVNIRPLLWDLQIEPEIMENIDIGLAPLWGLDRAAREREFDKYKCGFKVINYMAAGIATIASAVGEHVYIIRDGVNGFLCRNSGDWKCKLEILIEDSKLRESIGNNARKTVEEKYSLEKNVEPIVKLLQKA